MITWKKRKQTTPYVQTPAELSDRKALGSDRLHLGETHTGSSLPPGKIWTIRVLANVGPVTWS